MDPVNENFLGASRPEWILTSEQLSRAINMRKWDKVQSIAHSVFNKNPYELMNELKTAQISSEECIKNAMKLVENFDEWKNIESSSYHIARLLRRYIEFAFLQKKDQNNNEVHQELTTLSSLVEKIEVTQKQNVGLHAEIHLSHRILALSRNSTVNSTWKFLTEALSGLGQRKLTDFGWTTSTTANSIVLSWVGQQSLRSKEDWGMLTEAFKSARGSISKEDHKKMRIIHTGIVSDIIGRIDPNDYASTKARKFFQKLFTKKKGSVKNFADSRLRDLIKHESQEISQFAQELLRPNDPNGNPPPKKQDPEIPKLRNSRFPSVVETRISANGEIEAIRITEKAWKYNALEEILRTYSHLVEIDLSEVKQDIKNSDLKIISSVSTTLNSLDLKDCVQVTDQGIQNLANLPELRSLNIEGCSVEKGINELLSQDVFTKLKTVFGEQILGIAEGQVTAISIAEETRINNRMELLKSFYPYLLSLDLSAVRDTLTDDNLEQIGELTSLTSLNLMNCKQITGKGLAVLSKLKALTSLNLLGCDEITDDGLEHLFALTSLAKLNLDWCGKITDVGLVKLGQLPKLETLRINENQKITEEGLDDFPNLIAVLQKVDSAIGLSLDFSGVGDRLTDNHLEQIAQIANSGVVPDPNNNNNNLEIDQEIFPAITSLNLMNCKQITNKGLEYLRSLINLKSLILQYCGEIEDAGLESLSNLTNLTSINLFDCKKITDKGLTALSKLKALTSLNLLGCDEITNEGLEHLLALTSLAELNLDWCGKITDKGLVKLGQLPKLETLRINENQKITEEGLANFQTLTDVLKKVVSTNLSLDFSGVGDNLTNDHLAQIASIGVVPNSNNNNLQTDQEILLAITSLNLMNCKQITNKGLEYLRSLINLKSLILQYCGEIEDAGLESLSNLTNLTSLNLFDCKKITDKGLAALSKLKALTSLNLLGCDEITNEGLEHLLALTSLAELNLDWCGKITDEGFVKLGQLPKLETLRINENQKITEAGLANFRTLTDVLKKVVSTNLSLDFSGVGDSLTDNHLEQIAQIANIGVVPDPNNNNNLEIDQEILPAITSLNLAFCDQITDEGLKHLIPLTHLTWIDLLFCQIGDEGFGFLSQITALQSIKFEEHRNRDHNNITDKGLEYLGSLPNLTSLTLINCKKITNKGLESLTNLVNLATLDLLGSNITNDGLQTLVLMKSLQRLYLAYCPRITIEGLAPLLQQLPHLATLKIDHCNQITAEANQQLKDEYPKIDIQG